MGAETDRLAGTIPYEANRYPPGKDRFATRKYADAMMRSEKYSPENKKAGGTAMAIRRPPGSNENQPRVSEIEAPRNWLSARITTDCLLPRVVSEMLAEKPGALATT
jgi:hypothetical protein